ncbi:MAG: hypothetical protein PHI28_11270 [Mangrovibacterium sp.]|nr:hypothetical protein [Mangrovibacterium sp.]
MKKVLFLLLMSGLLFACEGPAGPMGPPGEQGEPGEPGEGSNWTVLDFNIKKNDWQRSGGENELGSYFFVNYDVPQLTTTVYNDGIVMAYIEFEGSFQTPLPYTRYYGEQDEGQEYLWSEILDYEYTTGGITFYSTPSDFATGIVPDGAVIRVAFIW